MTKTTMGRVVAFGALMIASIIVVDAKAQCCGQSATAFAQPTTTFYQPTTTFYQPVAVQAYRPASSWYPGMWLGRLNRRIWGVPETYAVAAPTTYTAAYAPTYTASYAPSYSVGYSTTAYAAPAATYSAPACTTCAMPVVSACDPCCGATTVTQAAYQSSPGCIDCGVAPATYEGPATTSPSPPKTFSTNTPEEAPGLDPTADVSTAREQEAQRPATEGTTDTTESLLDQEPATDSGEGTPTNGTPPANGAEGNSTYFEAPQLFDPSDRAARRSAAPVRTAVFHRPTSQTTLTAAKISWQQAQQDAAGWTSAGK